MFVIFHPQAVCARGQGVLFGQLAGAAITPLVNDQLIVHPQACAIVHDDVEAIGRRVEHGCARPASRKVIVG